MNQKTKELWIIPSIVAVAWGLVLIPVAAWLTNVPMRTVVTLAGIKNLLFAPVSAWTVILAVMLGLVLAFLYWGSHLALKKERRRVAELIELSSTVKSQIEDVQSKHLSEIEKLRQVSGKQGFVDAPLIHMAWDGKTRWRWSFVKNQQALRIEGLATMELDNTRRAPLITGVQIEGAQFVGEFSNFQLVPGQRAYQTLSLDFTGITPKAGEPLTVKFVFTDLKGELFPTKEMTFQPNSRASTTVGEVATQKKNIMPLPPR